MRCVLYFFCAHYINGLYVNHALSFQGRMERKFLDKGLSIEAPCREKPWRSPGLEPVAPNRSENRKHCALLSQPNPHLHDGGGGGEGGGGLAELIKRGCFPARRFEVRAIRRFEQGFLRGFSQHGASSLGLCLERFIPCTILSYPGQPPPLFKEY